jgi:hypothetical protein
VPGYDRVSSAVSWYLVVENFYKGEKWYIKKTLGMEFP